MSRYIKKCKLCGKAYEACHTPYNGLFRWRDVACCPEHADEYCRLVMESRDHHDAINQIKADMQEKIMVDNDTFEAESVCRTDNGSELGSE